MFNLPNEFPNIDGETIQDVYVQIQKELLEFTSFRLPDDLSKSKLVSLPIMILILHNRIQKATFFRNADTWEIHIHHRTDQLFSSDLRSALEEIGIRIFIHPEMAWKFVIHAPEAFKILIEELRQMEELP